MKQKYDSRNDNLKVFIKDKIVDRADAKISVFDSLVQGGDGVWEGLRVYNGRIFCLDKHLERMYHSAKALGFADIPSMDFIKNAIFETLKANGMRDETHIRLTLSRGEKYTSGMDPRLNTKGSCLIVLAEWKPPVYDNKNGVKLITSSIRRNSPMHLDSKIHHNNLLNNILAKIEANYAGADEAIMLDAYGFVSEANATNMFMVQKDTLLTPHADACLPGITRGLVIEIAKELGIPVIERNLSVSEFMNGDQVFKTGTMGELTPVKEIDGRLVENRSGSDVFDRIQNAFRKRTMELGEPLPF